MKKINTLIAVTERDLHIAKQQLIMKEKDKQRKMRYTHLEVDPFTILGVVGGIIPVCNLYRAIRIGFFFLRLPVNVLRD